MDYTTTKFFITTIPTKSTTSPVKISASQQLHQLNKKYKVSWRIIQLAKPLHINKKYVPPEVKPAPKRVPPTISPESQYYSDQLSRPPIRRLLINKRMYRNQGKKFRKNIGKTLKLSWKSIYNVYKNKERLDLLKKRKHDKQKGIGKKAPAKDQKISDRLIALAKPKELPKEEKDETPKKVFGSDNLARLDDLSAPKAYIIEEPKRDGVNPACLTYEPTEIIQKLALIPKRWQNLPQPLIPGKVVRAALFYKITPRTEALAQPRPIKSKAAEENDEMWTISKNALKYKASARILELAKPKERK